MSESKGLWCGGGNNVGGIGSELLFFFLLLIILFCFCGSGGGFGKY